MARPDSASRGDPPFERVLFEVASRLSGATGAQVYEEVARGAASLVGAETAIVGFYQPSCEDGEIRTAAVWSAGALAPNFAYPLAGTPCRDVVGRVFLYFRTGVATHYPEPEIEAAGIEGYAAFPLVGTDGAALGLIATMSRGPIEHPLRVETVLRLLAERVIAEAERTGARAALDVAEESYRASEALYRSIFEASVDALALLTPEGVFVDVNAAMLPMTGFTPAELIGRNALDFLPERHHAQARDFFRAALTQGYARAEQKTRRKDGVELRLEPRGVPVTWDGRPHLLVVVRDITDARARQRALERSESRLRATVDAALDCIVTLDERGLILDFNPASERCFGRTRNEALGKPFVDLVVAPATRAQCRAAFAGFQADAATPPDARRLALICRRADGSELPMELAIGAAASAEGTVFIAYLHDLTGRLEAERTREELERQLRQAQKMEAIGQLTGGIAHDFNNILTSVIGYIGLALDDETVAGRPELRRYLERARRSGDRARDLIQQMLTYTRGTRSRPQRVAVEELVEEVVTLLDATLPATIQLDLALARDLPSVHVDPVQAAQALMNLCINARDAMAGHGLLEIGACRAPAPARRHCASCNAPLEGEFVMLSVSDTGAGIPPALLERIFEPFFSTKATGKGSGMGLATTHGILHQHGGHILVDSACGKGTRFSLLLPPLADSEGPPARRDAVPIALPEPPPPALHGRILLVDDNAAVVEFVQDLLCRWGLEVTALRDSEAAAARFARAPDHFDLALLDQTMPRLTGIELAVRLLATRPALPVVLYTGHSDVITDAGVRAAGVRALLRKPIEESRLREVLAAALASGDRVP